jgi:hypothetical protein
LEENVEEKNENTNKEKFSWGYFIFLMTIAIIAVVGGVFAVAAPSIMRSLGW